MSGLTIKQLCEQSHALSKEKGWWDKDEALIALANAVLGDARQKQHHETARRVLYNQREEPQKIPEKLMLMVSEISEALESHRKNEPLAFYVCGCAENLLPGELAGDPAIDGALVCEDCKEFIKPEGMRAECADIAIRLGDFCQRWGIDLERGIREKHAFNAKRSHRHGGKSC